MFVHHRVVHTRVCVCVCMSVFVCVCALQNRNVYFFFYLKASERLRFLNIEVCQMLCIPHVLVSSSPQAREVWTITVTILY